jgi:hypothetical protein
MTPGTEPHGKRVVRITAVSLLSKTSADTSPEGGADMESMQRVLIPGAHASGLDVSTGSRGWQHKRPYVAVLNEFPTVDGTGVSAGGCRT